MERWASSSTEKSDNSDRWWVNYNFTRHGQLLVGRIPQRLNRWVIVVFTDVEICLEKHIILVHAWRRQSCCA